jgi:N-acetylglucosamine-6-phosphate deacetylase
LLAALRLPYDLRNMYYLHRFTLPNSAISHAAIVVGQRLTALGPVEAMPRPPEAQPVEADGLILSPGFIDLQLNGAFGLDFTANPATLWEVAARLPQFGVTAFLPTLISAPLETYARALAVLQAGPPPGWRGAAPLGYHFEGPFLNPHKRGAHNPAHLRLPSLAPLAHWSRAAGVWLVTLAPELPQAHAVIRALTARGVLVSAGHSMATYAEALAAFDAGARYGTHLFNAMPPLDHRAPGLVAALLADPRLTVGLIADGVHVHPGLFPLIWKNTGPTRLNLVTDAMAALGMTPGQYHLGDFDVTVDETSARLSDGCLAGSLLRLDVAARNLMACTACSVSEALATVTRVPAQRLGLADRGHLTPGALADLVLLTPDLQVVWAMARGEVVYEKRVDRRYRDTASQRVAE